MHCNPNDRLSKQEQKQPPEAASLPRGDRDDEGNLKFGDHPQAKENAEAKKSDEQPETADQSAENAETKADEFEQAAGI